LIKRFSLGTKLEQSDLPQKRNPHRETISFNAKFPFLQSFSDYPAVLVFR
jgi:hypothetical protein